MAAVQSSGSTVYVIGVGGVAGISFRGERLLKHIAAATGGRAYFPSREEQLPDVHDNVVSDSVEPVSHHLYPQRISKSTVRWRAVSLATVNPAYKVRVKPGYFAPKPPPVRPILEFTVTDTARRHLSILARGLEVARRRPRAGHRHVPRSHEPRLDRPWCSTRVAHSAGQRRRAKAAARSFVGALRPEDKLAAMRFSDRSILDGGFSTARGQPEGDRCVRTAGRDGTLRCRARRAFTTRRRGRPPRGGVLTDGRDENAAGTGPGSDTTFDELLKTLAPARRRSSRSRSGRTSVVRASRRSRLNREGRLAAMRPVRRSQPHDTAGRRTERLGGRDLGLPGERARELQVGDVGAGEQQHESDGRPEQPRIRTEIAGGCGAEGRGFKTDARVGFGVEPSPLSLRTGCRTPNLKLRPISGTRSLMNERWL